jgi:hypothetical protein
MIGQSGKAYESRQKSDKPPCRNDDRFMLNQIRFTEAQQRRSSLPENVAKCLSRALFFRGVVQPTWR